MISSTKLKKHTIITFIIGLIILSLVVIFHVLSYYRFSKNTIIENLKTNFYLSIYNYIEDLNYSTQNNISYVFSNHEATDSVTVLTEQGETKYLRTTENRLDVNPTFNVLCSYYYVINKIYPDSILILYNNKLKEENLLLTTSLLYIDNVKQDSVYTPYPGKNFIPIYDIPKYVGVGNEMSFQCYVNIPASYIIKGITASQWYVIGGWTLLLTFVILFAIYGYKKVYRNILETVNVNVTVPEEPNRQNPLKKSGL